MASTVRQFTLPDEEFRLEEINMPEEMADELAGMTVAVKVLPEVPPHRPGPPVRSGGVGDHG